MALFHSKRSEEPKSIFKNKEERSVPSPLDKEITIRLNPRKVLKWLIVLLVLVLVFYAGRLSAEPSCPSKTASTSVKSSWGSWNITGFIQDLWPDSEPVKKTTKKVVKKVAGNKTNTTGSSTVPSVTTSAATSSSSSVAASGSTTTATTATTANTSATPMSTTEETAESTEPIITKYSKVALSLSCVQTEWLETWGKITQIQLVIKNNEEGTVKPNYIKMMMEGYNDREEKVELPEKMKTIKATQSVISHVLVPGGFSYNSANVGNLQSVKIQLYLFNAEGTPMASYSRDVDLNGKKMC
ncbi:hypothetical protein HYX14_01315 [Candidatus Woesearchaeota archaeon]|nr:hypothetical protein [Candidatus Woesearchaeota archaeon]